jgi:hypothetical protein
MNADVGSGADGGHGLRFGKDLRVRPDSHLEVLRPDALRDQRVFDGLRLR